MIKLAPAALAAAAANALSLSLPSALPRFGIVPFNFPALPAKLGKPGRPQSPPLSLVCRFPLMLRLLLGFCGNRASANLAINCFRSQAGVAGYNWRSVASRLSKRVSLGLYQ